MPTSTFICAVIDGVFGAQGERVQFHEARLLCPADIAAVQRAARTRVLRLFARRGLIPPEAAAEMRQWEHGGGFSLEAGVRIAAADRKGLGSQGQGGPCWARRGRNGCSVIAPGRSLPGSASQLTSFSGLIFIQALFARLVLKERLRRCFSRLTVSPIFGHATLVLCLVLHLTLGYRRLRDMRYYSDDPLVMRTLGLRRLPDVATLSRGLARADAESVKRLQGFVRGGRDPARGSWARACDARLRWLGDRRRKTGRGHGSCLTSKPCKRPEILR
jgi:hypothetical protein